MGNEKGSAIFLTVLVAAVVMIAGLGFTWLVREHLRASESLKIKAEAMLAARSAYSVFMYTVLTAKITNQDLVLSTEGQTLLEKSRFPLNNTAIPFGKDVTLFLQDCKGLFSLPVLNGEAFGRLFHMKNPKDEFVGILASYSDWIDDDNFARINGAERLYYELQGQAALPRNYPMQYKEELSFIKGMNTTIYDRMAPFLTILPCHGFNPNTASAEVLMAYLNIDQETVDVLKDRIQRLPVLSDSELFSLTGRKIEREGGIYFFPSTFMEMSIKAGLPKTVYTISAGIDLRETMKDPFTVVYWKES